MISYYELSIENAIVSYFSPIVVLEILDVFDPECQQLI